MTARQGFALRLLAYINDELIGPDAPLVTPDTDLFAGEVLNSLSLLNVLAFVEDAIGTEIPDEDIVMDSFATVEHIAEAFWKDR